MVHNMALKFAALSAVIILGLVMIFVGLSSTPNVVQNFAQNLQASRTEAAEPVSQAIRWVHDRYISLSLKAAYESDRQGFAPPRSTKTNGRTAKQGIASVFCIKAKFCGHPFAPERAPQGYILFASSPVRIRFQE